METRRRRAPAMEPEERRAAIVTATLPLLVEHGAAVTTGQIASAAGVAEGTVFRAFADKHELLWACHDAAVDPAQPVATLAEIPLDLPLHERLRRAGSAVAGYWERAMQVGHAVRTSCATPPTEPPMRRGPQCLAEGASAVHLALADLLSPDTARLRLGPERTARLFLVTVLGGEMTRLRFALGAATPGDTEDLLDVFLHGAVVQP
ncbi:MAG: TetR/AcrR family transcriptional regulator [Chloroflexi bacterium]|nr:TetR/AcrR family transcriptional regulator [Chloroflexota bacterium]